MKRPVALSLRLIGVAVVAILAFTACAPSTTTASHAPATSVVKERVTQPPAGDKQAIGAVPVATACDQNTRPAYVPDSSGFALIPGGGNTYKEIFTKANVSYDSSGSENAARVFNSLLPVDMTSAKSVASIQDGVMCPDGHIYIYGNPKALTTHARIIDNNSAGPTAKPYGGGTFSHNAAEVLQAPCPAFIKVVIYLSAVKTLFFAAVCKNNGDELDTNSLFN